MVTYISEQVLCEISKQGLWFLTETDLLGRGIKWNQELLGNFHKKRRQMVFVVRMKPSSPGVRVWKVAGYPIWKLGNNLNWFFRDHPNQVVVTRQMQQQIKSEDLVSSPFLLAVQPYASHLISLIFDLKSLTNMLRVMPHQLPYYCCKTQVRSNISKSF